MLRAALLPCHRRAGRTKDAVEVGLVSFSFSSFDLSNRPSNFAGGETITLHFGRKKKMKRLLDFNTNCRRSRHAVIHNQFNEIRQAR